MIPVERPFGFLLFGLVLGLGAGIAVAKHSHAVEAIVAGVILGPIAGGLLESHYRERRRKPE